MYGLLYKELVVNKKSLLMLAGTALFFLFCVFIVLISDIASLFTGSDLGAAANVAVLVYTIIMFMFLTIMGSMIFENDESAIWSRFIASTPFMQRGHVRAKYIFGFLMQIAMFLQCFIAEIVFKTYISARYDIPIKITSPEYCLTMMIILTILSAFEYPFYIRFGSKTGSGVRKAIFAGICLFIVIYLLFGKIPDIGQSLDSFVDFFLKILGGEMLGKGKTLIFAAAAAVCYLLSYFVSRDLYLKGAEGFEM